MTRLRPAEASESENFCGLAFKIVSDPFVGNLAFIRVYSGILKVGSQVYNPVKSKKEKIGRIVKLHANKREDVQDFCRRYRGPCWSAFHNHRVTPSARQGIHSGLKPWIFRNR